MMEILNEIVYLCGAGFLIFVAFMIIAGIVLSIKEITYDAHRNKSELDMIKHRYKKEKETIAIYKSKFNPDEMLEILDYVVEGKQKR